MLFRRGGSSRAARLAGAGRAGDMGPGGAVEQELPQPVRSMSQYSISDEMTAAAMMMRLITLVSVMMSSLMSMVRMMPMGRAKTR